MCRKIDLKHLIVILSWLVVVGAAGIAAMAFLSGLGSFYHPQSEGAYLRGFYGFYSLGVFVCALFIAFFITSKREVWPVLAQAGVLCAFGALVCVGYFSFLAFNPQPSHSLMTLNGTPYAMPREYVMREETERVERVQIGMSVCLTNLQPYYGPNCVKEYDLSAFGWVQLSSKPITSDFLVLDVLEIAGVSFEADVLAEIPAQWVLRSNLVRIEENRTVLMMELDSDRKIMRAVWCRGESRMCTALAATKHGQLKFPMIGSDDVDTVRWDRDQTRFEALFDGWRCDDISCGGLFVDGATIAYE